MNRQKIEIVGRIVVKPEVLKSKGDKDYAKVRVAVNSKGKDKKGKEIEQVTYYVLLVFGKRAERSANLDKGMLVRAVGDLEVRPFLSKKGEAKAGLTVFVREFQVFDTEVFKK